MPANAPFFIVGVPRSGTTLLAVLLNSHSQIYVGKTTSSHALLELHRQVMESYGLEGDVRCRSLADRVRQALPPQDRVWELCPNEANLALEDVRRLLALAQAETVRRHGKAVWGDKSPFMLNQIPQLSHLMPNARFIHVLRDGRAVAQSRHRRRGFHPRLAMHEWKRMILLGRLDGETIGPERYLEVKFEALLTDTWTEIARICDWLGVDFEEAMLNLQTAEGTDQADAYVGKEIDASKIDAWQDQFTPEQVEALECIGGDLLQALGHSLQRWPAAGPFRSLTPLEVIWYRQQRSLHDLLRSKRTAMIDRQLVELSLPFRSRVRQFLAESADLYFSQRVIEHFRQRRIMLD